MNALPRLVLGLTIGLCLVNSTSQAANYQQDSVMADSVLIVEYPHNNDPLTSHYLFQSFSQDSRLAPGIAQCIGKLDAAKGRYISDQRNLARQQMTKQGATSILENLDAIANPKASKAICLALAVNATAHICVPCGGGFMNPHLYYGNQIVQENLNSLTPNGFEKLNKIIGELSIIPLAPGSSPTTVLDYARTSVSADPRDHVPGNLEDLIRSIMIEMRIVPGDLPMGNP